MHIHTQINIQTYAHTDTHRSFGRRIQISSVSWIMSATEWIIKCVHVWAMVTHGIEQRGYLIRSVLRSV